MVQSISGNTTARVRPKRQSASAPRRSKSDEKALAVIFTFYAAIIAIAVIGVLVGLLM